MSLVLSRRSVTTALQLAYQQALKGMSSLGDEVVIYTTSAGAIKRPCIVVGEWHPIRGSLDSPQGQTGRITLEAIAWRAVAIQSANSVADIIDQIPVKLRTDTGLPALKSPHLLIDAGTVGRSFRDGMSYRSNCEERTTISVVHTIWGK